MGSSGAGGGLATGIALGVLAWPEDDGASSEAMAQGDFAPYWNTYINVEQAYLIHFPPGWKLLAEATACGSDGFCTQSIELTRGEEASVFVVVNFQGG